MFSNFFAGASYALKGFSLIRRPGLRRYFVIPISLNILIFATLIWYGAGRFISLIQSWVPEGGAWWAGALAIVIVPLFGLAVLMIIFFGFTLLLNLIGAPFNGILSEKVEAILNREPLANKGGFGRFMGNFISSIKGELRKYLYFALLGLVVIATSFIPGVNVVFAFLLGGWMMALEYIAYPMANHEKHFPEVRRWAWSNVMLSLGFGMMVLLLSITPILNFVVMPAAVAGATLMWNERREFFGTSGVA